MTEKLYMDAYAAYGLQKNPFLIYPLAADEQGARLLVGRDNEISVVAQRLHKHGKITCLDGHIGVGKTSLVNVASFKCFQAYLTGQTTQLLIPMAESFQLEKDQNIDRFCLSVFRRVAQTLLDYRTTLRQYERSEAIARQLGPWLNSPTITHINGALGINGNVGLTGVASGGIKIDGSSNAQTNTTTGFSEQGFEQLVRQWLNEIFSVQGNGGVVCVIDNLELLESGSAARTTLETLRDRLFTVNGLRWVFCGAEGVIQGLASSTRLGAYLNTPILEVGKISPAAIAPLYRARLNEFADDPEAAERNLPIRVQDLEKLYLALNFNLRDLLHTADEYCEHLFSARAQLNTDSDKARRFMKWLDVATTDRYRTLQSRLPADAWGILDFAMSDECKGTFGVGAYEVFNRNHKRAVSPASFKRMLKDLVVLSLLSKSLDDAETSDEGFRRDVFTVTGKGALVHYARIQKNESQTLLPTNWLKRVHSDDRTAK